MKSRNIIIYLSLVCSLMFIPSCIQDLGNYDYKSSEDIMPVKVAKMSDTSVLMGQKFELQPVVDGVTDESKYTYSWYVYNRETPVDTISRSKNLSEYISLAPGSYSLHLEIRDKKTNVYVNQRVSLVVSANPIIGGWYILKDKDNVTDFDYINRTTGEKILDVLSKYAPKERLRGQGVSIAFQNGQYFHQIKNPDGTTTLLKGQAPYQIVSTIDFKTIEYKQFKLFKNYEDQFYGLPAVRKPELCRMAPGTVYFINNGQVHLYLRNAVNVGKFGAALITRNAAPAYIKKDIMTTYSNLAIGFDTISRSFFGLGNGTTFLNPFAEKNGSVSPSKMEYRLLNLLQKGEENDYLSTMSMDGFAIMQKDTPDDKRFYFINITLTKTATTYPFTTQPELIPTDAKMPLAPVKAASREGMAVYFAYGNVVSSYIHATGVAEREKVVKTFPADEVVGYMKNFKRAATPELAAGSDLVVLTNSTKGWRLYAFNVITPGEIDPTPRFMYEGTGTGRDVMYR